MTLATSPDGSLCVFFLALGGDDSDNYIVHQKAVVSGGEGGN